MKYWIHFCIALCLPPLISGDVLGSSIHQEKLPDQLWERLQSSSSDEFFDVLVHVAPNGGKSKDLKSLAASAATLHERYDLVRTQLTTAASVQQDFVRHTVQSLSGRIEVIRQFWISSVAHMRVDSDGLRALIARDEVIQIAPNVPLELLHPVGIADAVAASVGAEANLRAVGANALWSRGLTGKGRIVASIDTGVEGIHPALAERWRGRNGDTSAAWFDPFDGSAPIDENGHGTHVMGIMAGRAGADTIGLAPDAEWICAAVVDRGRSLSTTFADILSALEWIVDPDGDPATMSDVPDVVCNSWGVSQQIINPCDQLFFDAIDNVEALGVVCVFAAGNEGPNPMSIRNPADRATSPTASFSVGAIDAIQTILPIPAFSSRGPSACDGLAMKPEIVAPGVSIRSSYKGQTYKLINGTSMSAPHVAAAVALLRQYNPELTPEEIKYALLSTARDVGAPGEDNASGHGLLDLEAAVVSLPSPLYPLMAIGTCGIDLTGDGIASAGESVQFVVPITVDVTDAQDVTLHVTSLSSGISTTSGSAYFGDILVGQMVDNAYSPFEMTTDAGMRAGDTAWFELRMTGDPMTAHWRDTIGLPLGLPPNAVTATVSDGQMALTFSNFGQMGLSEGSSLHAGGAGWQTSLTGDNILHEAALLVSSADGGWADASRRVPGESPFDFAPQVAGERLRFNDSRSSAPIGVLIEQRAILMTRRADYDYTVVTWTVHNRHPLPIEGFQLGWLVDIDLPARGACDEWADFDVSSGGLLHRTENVNLVAGVAPLTGRFAGRHIFESFGASKRILTAGEKRAALTGLSESSTSSGDYFAVVATSPVDLPVGDSVTIALAFITARDQDKFSGAAADARDRWMTMSGVTDDNATVQLPSDFTLHQNYPNPFNAGTTIPFELKASPARLIRIDIFDVLGRRVRTIESDLLELGPHSLFWDGTNDDGADLASGVYFSRLVADGKSGPARQMVLLK